MIRCRFILFELNDLYCSSKELYGLRLMALMDSYEHVYTSRVLNED